MIRLIVLALLLDLNCAADDVTIKDNTCGPCAGVGFPHNVRKFFQDGRIVLDCKEGRIAQKVGEKRVLSDHLTCLNGDWYGLNCATTPTLFDELNYVSCPEQVSDTDFLTLCETPYYHFAEGWWYENNKWIDLRIPRAFCNADTSRTVYCPNDIITLYAGDQDSVITYSEEFDFLSVKSDGFWYGTKCDGSSKKTTFNDSINVRCNKEYEKYSDFYCAPIPQEGSWITYKEYTDDQLKRLECPEGLTISLLIEYSKSDNPSYRKIEHGAYIDCNHTYHRVASSVDGKFFSEPTQKILSATCEDLGAMHSACSIPWDNNAIRTGNNYKCTKGSFLSTINLMDASGTGFAIQTSANNGMDGMTCEEDGWRIHGTTYTAATVTGFICWDVQFTYDANCNSGKIKGVATHFNYDSYSKMWSCASNEYMTIDGQPHPTAIDRKLFCKKNAQTGVYGWAWKSSLDGNSDAFLAEGATVDCTKDFCDTVPQKGSGLINRVDTADHLKRLECPAGLTLSLVIDYKKSDDPSYRKIEHGAFIDCNNTYHRISSSVEGQFFSEPANKITSVTCENLGPTHRACSIPWDNNAIRTGNKYTCTKGSYLVQIRGIESNRNEFGVFGDEYAGMGEMTCEEGGWRIHGTPYVNKTVTGFLCWDVNMNGDANCASGKIKAVGTHFAFDDYSKMWTCPSGEYMTANGTAHPTNIDRKLFCKKNATSGLYGWAWKSYSDNKTDQFLAEGTIVDCAKQDFYCATVPQTDSMLYLVGTTADNLTRLACKNDLTLSMVIDFYNADPNYRKTEHGAYIDCNNTYHRVVSSIDGKFFSEPQKIKNLTCEDFGPRYAACSVPWDNNARRTGLKYACTKGNYPVSVRFIDDNGYDFVFFAWGYDGLREMTCEQNGWRINGTSYSGVSVTGFVCWDVKFTEDSRCDRTKINGIPPHFDYDPYNKIWTCAEGYMTVNGQAHAKTYDRKLYCRKNEQTGAFAWAWKDYCGGGSEEFIPNEATVACKV